MISGRYYWFLFGSLSLALMLFVVGIENPRCADEKATGHRVALAFYGLSRSLRKTLPSFEKHVFGVLDNQSIAYDVFWSGMDSGQINNERSGERHIVLDSTEFSLIRPCVFTVMSQSVVVPMEIKLYKEARISEPEKIDLFHDNQQSVRNLLAAFHALRTAHTMIVRYAHGHNITYDAVVVLRPDTAVVTDIDIAQHLPQIVEEENQFAAGMRESHSIWVPDFQHWSGYNDRAAYGSLRVLSPFMTRGTVFRDGTGVGNATFRNGEMFLRLFLHAHNVSVHPSTLRLVRVRADGSVAQHDTEQINLNMNNTVYNRFVLDCLHYNGVKLVLPEASVALSIPANLSSSDNYSIPADYAYSNPANNSSPDNYSSPANQIELISFGVPAIIPPLQTAYFNAAQC